MQSYRRGPLAEAHVVIPEEALDTQSSGNPAIQSKRNHFKRQFFTEIQVIP